MVEISLQRCIIEGTGFAIERPLVSQDRWQITNGNKCLTSSLQVVSFYEFRGTFLEWKQQTMFSWTEAKELAILYFENLKTEDGT